jgi:hypothetical protein
MANTKTYPIYISHNEFGYANPSAISSSANEVVFDMAKISEELKSKVYGQIGIVELTRAEMQEIHDARTGIYRVGAKMMANLGIVKE